MVQALGGIGIIGASGAAIGGLATVSRNAATAAPSGAVQASFTLNISEAGKAALTAEIDFGSNATAAPMNNAGGVTQVSIGGTVINGPLFSPTVGPSGTPITTPLTIDLGNLLLALNGTSLATTLGTALITNGVDADNVRSQLLAALLAALLLNQLNQGSVLV